MKKYYGLFEELKEIYSDSIEEVGVYEGEFARIYSLIAGENYDKEIDFYVNAALCSGKNILEVACGDGKRLMIPLAKLGFNVDGVEISENMIDMYKNHCKKMTHEVRLNTRIFECDIFKFTTNKKYDLITIPATTICLLSDNEERIIELFNRFYEMLYPEGRLVFDYKANQSPEKSKTKLRHLVFEYEKSKFFILFQEFNNYLRGRSIANFYLQKETDEGVKKFLTSSSKKIITEEFIQMNIISKTKFKLDRSLDINLGASSEKIKMLSLKKEGNDDLLEKITCGHL